MPLGAFPRAPVAQWCRRPGSPERLHEGGQQPVLVTVPSGQVVWFHAAPLRSALVRFALERFAQLTFACVRFARVRLPL